MATIKAKELQKWDTSEQATCPETGRKVWIPARPFCCDGVLKRLKAAWRVFTGKSDELSWEV